MQQRRKGQVTMRWMAFVCAMFALPAQAYDFKGVELGKHSAADQIDAKLGVKCRSGWEGSQICNGPVTVGGVPAKLNLVMNSQGVVIRILLRFGEHRFDTLEEAVTQEFGAPSSTKRRTLPNRRGAFFDQVVHYWKGATGDYVRLSRFTGI